MIGSLGRFFDGSYQGFFFDDAILKRLGQQVSILPPPAELTCYPNRTGRAGGRNTAHECADHMRPTPGSALHAAKYCTFLRSFCPLWPKPHGASEVSSRQWCLPPTGSVPSFGPSSLRARCSLKKLIHKGLRGGWRGPFSSTQRMAPLAFRRREISNDVRELQSSKDPRARFAFDHFCYRVGIHADMLAAALRGLDAFVFTAGIGENSANIRAEIVAKL